MEAVNLKNCSGALVYGTNHKPLSKARVLDTGSSIYLFFENRNLRQAYVKVYVDFYTPRRGVLRCFCDLHICRNQQIGNSQEIWAAECKVLEVASVIQRQKDLRVDINTPIFYTTESSIFTRGVIKNISAGGVFLITKRVLKNGTKLTYDHVLANERCEVTAQVVYGRVLPGGYGYGCSFCGLPAQTEHSIRTWCFEHQERRVAE